MAKAGFYYTGSSKDDDSATCFVCGKVLDGWVRLQNKQGMGFCQRCLDNILMITCFFLLNRKIQTIHG